MSTIIKEYKKLRGRKVQKTIILITTQAV